MHVFVEPDTIVSETETRNLSLLRLADLTGLLELRAESAYFRPEKINGFGVRIRSKKT